MIIGVPKEIKNNENRVGMTPSGVAEVVKQGHQVYIQHTQVSIVVFRMKHICPSVHRCFRQ